MTSRSPPNASLSCSSSSLGRSMIYDMIEQGRFPRPDKILLFASRWIER
ncbi:AlpA family phage regulatory protein (plasmid) [Sphingomonas changnyeongensis]|uniref:AlpA family phage regulatory protein n=1 Tax=Sphingomonas changnyeongensis TaxID=2698679 RepID=A0A7Z2NYH1_9SPHN|nr:AlpA family phage regulatory protein [Sphingomonas changnyeongensis]